MVHFRVPDNECYFIDSRHSFDVASSLMKEQGAHLSKPTLTGIVYADTILETIK